MCAVDTWPIYRVGGGVPRIADAAIVVAVAVAAAVVVVVFVDAHDSCVRSTISAHTEDQQHNPWENGALRRRKRHCPMCIGKGEGARSIEREFDEISSRLRSSPYVLLSNRHKFLEFSFHRD